MSSDKPRLPQRGDMIIIRNHKHIQTPKRLPTSESPALFRDSDGKRDLT